MARFKINDLPKDLKISKDEMKRVRGGVGTWPTPERVYFSYAHLALRRRFANMADLLKIDTVPLPEWGLGR